MDNYKLEEFQRSDQSNCYNQQVLVDGGQHLEVDNMTVDRPAADRGRMASGKNLSVAYMSWEGLNYEDAIILSQRVISEGLLISIHIGEHETDIHNTKLGSEEITRDIPNVSEVTRKDLGGRGVIRVGAEIHARNILTGKIIPGSEAELTSEERLLHTTLGEKVKEAHDTSLRVPHGESGVIVTVKKLTDEDEDPGLAPGVNHMVHVYVAQRRKATIGGGISGRHGNKGCISKVPLVGDIPFLEDDTPVNIILSPVDVSKRMNVGRILEFHPGWIARENWDITEALGSGEQWTEHAPLPIVESDQCVATPVSGGAGADAITGMLQGTRVRDKFDHQLIDENGRAQLSDGYSGESFPYRIAVDYEYVLKLHHLMDDRIHARFTSLYSMITQQPSGGKAQFGGRRFGEIGVRTLGVYGAAYALQEVLTVKPDDIQGRVKVYKVIIHDGDLPQLDTPESFRALVQEMHSLCLSVEVLDFDGYPLDMHDDANEASRGAAKLDSDLLERPNVPDMALNMEET